MAYYVQQATKLKADVEEFLISPAEDIPHGMEKVDEEIFSPDRQIRKLWTLVKLMRMARKSLRSNAAMYNALKIIFPYADFRDVPKDNKFGKGLKISIKVGDQMVSDDILDEDEDDS